MSYERTQEHRRLRAELIKRWKPWEMSTGPRTNEGKANSSRNSTKHGLWSAKTIDEIKLIKKFINNK